LAYIGVTMKNIIMLMKNIIMLVLCCYLFYRIWLRHDDTTANAGGETHEKEDH